MNDSPAAALKKPREIVDRKALVARLEALVAEGDLPKSKLKGKVLEILKEALAHGRAEVRRRLDSREANGTVIVQANCHLVDQIIRTIHDFAVTHVYPPGARTTGEQLSIVAVGGYGRGELAPQSDIDLLFLLPFKATPYVEQVVEYILYMLWDLGLKVGHATRTVTDCMRHAKADSTIRTAILEARWLWGDMKLYEELMARYRSEVAAGTGVEFVESKLAEREDRHGRMGDSRYVLEPNIKEGKGGLRDLHTLFWIAKYIYRIKDVHDLVDLKIITPDAAAKFMKAQNFFWTVRCHLHYLTERPEDRLTFDVQPEIARKLGYTDHAGTRGVERFMKHYFLFAKDVGDLTRIFCAVLEDQNKRKPKLGLMKFPVFRRNVEGFKIDSGRLDVAADEDFAKEPIRLIKLFHVAQAQDLDIHPHALKLVRDNLAKVNKLRENPEANRLFLEILTSPKDPEATLRQMNEAGVFGRLIPEFGRVVAQMQYDMYHVYTVDEHTIRAIGILHGLESGGLVKELPISSRIIKQVQSRRALYLSVLCHDIAKGRGGDHSVLGAEVAQKLCPRLGLTDEETETVSWLVLEHLTMSRTAFKRDIDDPQTIRDFVAKVQSPERLRLLVLLTVADIRAVGPTVWNNWKAGLLRELYYRAEAVLMGGQASEGQEARIEAAKEALSAALADWPREAVAAHLARPYPAYWLATDLDTQVRHAKLVREAEEASRPLTVEPRIDAARAVTEITVYVSDHAGLFSQIAGAMAVSGASIVDAKIITLANGMALDTFWIQDASEGAYESPERLKRVAETIELTLQGKLWLAKEIEKRRKGLPSRTSVFRVPPRVLLDNSASATHTVIEINGRDRLGLLYDVTAALTKLGLSIASAHISTYGERVVDVFYVKDVFGLKVHHEGKLKQIKEALMAALLDPADTRADNKGAAE